MDSPTPATGATGTDAAEFVRFCYHRRRVGWPDLYDEMCAVVLRLVAVLAHQHPIDPERIRNDCQ